MGERADKAEACEELSVYVFQKMSTKRARKLYKRGFMNPFRIHQNYIKLSLKQWDDIIETKRFLCLLLCLLNFRLNTWDTTQIIVLRL